MHKIYISKSYSPYFNLAFEEYLVRTHDPEDQVLFLWQNQNTVVIGRNQNPWKECNVEELERQGGHLVRRLSGGGAVFHDLGNLNFTFVSAFSEGKIKENIGLIIEALSLRGIPAAFSGKNDIMAEGYKISGNAFFVEDEILCHHGTLLVDTDFEKLNRILTVSRRKLESKGIDSVKSRVKNLKELNKDISIERFIADLVDRYSSFGDLPPIVSFVDESTENDYINRETVQTLMKRYQSWEWNFGSSPEFNLQISERFPWGEADLYLSVVDGIIVKAEIATDALDIDLPRKIKESIENKKFYYDEIISFLSTFSTFQ